MSGQEGIEGKGQGVHKAILINEHFVVHGVPAIAIPIIFPVDVTLRGEAGTGIRIFFKEPNGQAVMESNDSDTLKAVQAILRELDIAENQWRFDIYCRSELYGWRGIGSSAAVCVAVSRALCHGLSMSCPEEQINRAAFQGEKVFAENPSGIDNTVATYGRVLWYQRGKEQSWEFLAVKSPFWLIIGNSGILSLTRDQVAKVARFKQRYPKRFKKMCEEAEALAVDARQCLQKGEIAGLGLLMNQGHQLLQQLDVSHHQLDEMVALCRKQGAWGAKLTGAGGGGCMIALAADHKKGERIVYTLKENGYQAILVRVG